MQVRKTFRSRRLRTLTTRDVTVFAASATNAAGSGHSKVVSLLFVDGGPGTVGLCTSFLTGSMTSTPSSGGSKTLH